MTKVCFNICLLVITHPRVPLDGQSSDNQKRERSYTGVFSDYDFREWSVDRMRAEAARIMRMMNTTYDQV